MAAAVDEQLQRVGVQRGGGVVIDRAAEGAGAVGQRVGAAGDGGEARGERVDQPVVVVAVGGGDRQAVLQQLDAVAVVVGGVEVGAARGDEHAAAAAGAVRPHARRIAQHLGQVGHVALEQQVAVDHCHAAGGEGLFPLQVELQLPAVDLHGFQFRAFLRPIWAQQPAAVVTIQNGIRRIRQATYRGRQGIGVSTHRNSSNGKKAQDAVAKLAPRSLRISCLRRTHHKTSR